MSLRNMAWLGVNGFTFGNEWDFVSGHAMTVLTAADGRRLGVRRRARQAIDAAGDGVDAVYVGVDIDVVDFSLSPGTGSTNFGGITPVELLEAIDVLVEVPAIAALHMMEVAPTLDPSRVTARLAATSIMTVLMPRLFESVAEPARSP